MIAAWMAFTTLVTAVSGLFAWSIDRIAGDRGWPRRFVWLSAIAVAAVAVGARALAPLLERASVPAPPSSVVLLDGLRIPVAPEAQRVWLDPALLTIWAAGTLALLLFGVYAAFAVARKARAWRRARVDDTDVWVSDDTGPAVVGVLRPRIVLPRWSLAEDSLSMMVAHEREHVRAGDSRTLALAHLALVTAPWNLPLWWIVRRLRSAIEADCDLRVLRMGGVDTRRYCELLITVGSARQVRLHPLVALAEPRSRLEERIDQMTRGRLVLKKPVVLGLALLSAAALGLACSLPGLDVTGPSDVPTETTADPALQSIEALRAGPTFTPFTIRPDLVNRSEVMEALSEEYPPLLRDAGVGGQVNVWFFIDATGEVLEARVMEPSEHAALDEAALRVAMRMEFTPALNRSRPVPVWVAFPIMFRADGGQTGARRDGSDPRVYMSALRERMGATGETEAEARAYLESLGHTAPRDREAFEVEQILDADDPSLTFYTTPPVIQNTEAVRAALEAEHPPLLQEAGIGGTVDVWFHIDETGTLTGMRIHESSGHPALDEAALQVASQIEFSPALDGDTPIEVWVSFPITFRP